MTSEFYLLGFGPEGWGPVLLRAGFLAEEPRGFGDASEADESAGDCGAETLALEDEARLKLLLFVIARAMDDDSVRLAVTTLQKCARARRLRPHCSLSVITRNAKLRLCACNA